MTEGARSRFMPSGPTLRVLVVVLVVGAAAMVLATARYGIGLTPDSVVYLDGARSLANGAGYSRYGAPITLFAPGYSTVLSLGERIGIDASAGARGLAVVAFVATTALGFVLLRRHVRRTNVVIAGTVVIGFSAVLLQVFKEALSEHLFVVVVLLFLLAVEEIVERPRSVRLLGAATVLVWAGFYLRYAGLVMVPFLALVVLVAAWSLGLRQALIRSAGVLVAGISVPALWMIRNVHVGKGVLGTRHSAAAGPTTNASRTVKTLTGWLAVGGPGKVRLVVLLAVLVAAAVLLIKFRPAVPRLVARTRDVWPLLLFVVVYVGYIIVSASIAAFSGIDTRFLIPAYVPLVVLGAWMFERVRDHLPASGRTVLAVLAIVWIGLNVGWFGVTAVDAARDGAGGYAAAYWHRSRLRDDARFLNPGRTIYTNDIYGVELFAGREALSSPARTFQESNEETGILPVFVRRVRCRGHVTLVWFLPNKRGFLYSPQALKKHVRLKVKVRRADHVIYDVTPLPSSPRCHP